MKLLSWATRNSSLLKTHGLKTRNTIPDYPSSLSRLLPRAAAPSTHRSHLHTELILLGCGQARHRAGTAGQTRSHTPLPLQQRALSTQRINSSLAASHRSPPQMRPGSSSHRHGSADPKSRRRVPAPPSTDEPQQPAPNDCKSFLNLDYYSISLSHCSTQIAGMCSISLPLSRAWIL